MLQFFNKKTGQRGFTLIELLVVIAIIGILATIVLVSLNSARSKARNTRRVSDLRQIQLGQEIYYDSSVGNGAYATTLGALATGGAMSAVPKDPSSNGDYAFCAGTNNYVVGTRLEPTQVVGQGLMATTISAAKAGAVCALANGNPAVTSANCGTIDGSSNGFYCVSAQ
ncbi:MAG: hypothetical protein US76_02670 [Parcubacteria group bacterium GW2011_GWA2_38_13b]|nr:MAG: hypothetical protein US76_02670 [Parcubacteria group bacterium GW2011_GWA2_38_13b]